jgi:hypothetical protein
MKCQIKELKVGFSDSTEKNSVIFQTFFERIVNFERANVYVVRLFPS